MTLLIEFVIKKVVITAYLIYKLYNKHGILKSIAVVDLLDNIKKRNLSFYKIKYLLKNFYFWNICAPKTLKII